MNKKRLCEVQISGLSSYGQLSIQTFLLPSIEQASGQNKFQMGNYIPQGNIVENTEGYSS